MYVCLFVDQRPLIYKQAAAVVDKTFEYGRNNVVAALEDHLSTLKLN
jgi:hypothetical protein